MAQNLKERPVYLDLRRIRLPVTGIVSIAHRLTGVLLVLLTPVLIYLLANSIQSETGFRRVISFLDSWCVKLGLLAVVWVLAHHFFAGIRYLLIDIDIGVEKIPARRSAWIVHGLSVLTVLIAIGVLF